jgi:hypothetical protein
MMMEAISSKEKNISEGQIPVLDEKDIHIEVKVEE